MIFFSLINERLNQVGREGVIGAERVSRNREYKQSRRFHWHFERLPIEIVLSMFGHYSLRRWMHVCPNLLENEKLRLAILSKNLYLQNRNVQIDHIIDWDWYIDLFVVSETVIEYREREDRLDAFYYEWMYSQLSFNLLVFIHLLIYFFFLRRFFSLLSLSLSVEFNQ